jgi:hypothetical protein
MVSIATRLSLKPPRRWLAYVLGAFALLFDLHEAHSVKSATLVAWNCTLCGVEYAG